jgi:hypothetical protein
MAERENKRRRGDGEGGKEVGKWGWEEWRSENVRRGRVKIGQGHRGKGGE